MWSKKEKKLAKSYSIFKGLAGKHYFDVYFLEFPRKTWTMCRNFKYVLGFLYTCRVVVVLASCITEIVTCWWESILRATGMKKAQRCSSCSGSRQQKGSVDTAEMWAPLAGLWSEIRQTDGLRGRPSGRGFVAQILHPHSPPSMHFEK